MSDKYKLRTGDTLKCAACGNKEFQEESKLKEGRECWKYICEDCGHVMKFMYRAEKK